MSRQLRTKRRHSIETTPVRRSNSTELLRAKQWSDQMSEDEAEDEPAPKPERSPIHKRLLREVASARTSGDIKHFEPIVESLAEQMTKVFNDATSAFYHLHDMKVTATEQSERFAKLPVSEKINAVRSYPVEICREMLEAELLAAEKNEERLRLMTKRAYDLERRLEFSETVTDRIYAESIQKAESAIKDLFSQFSRQESILLLAHQNDVHSLAVGESMNKALEKANSTLTATTNRQTDEIAQLHEQKQAQTNELDLLSSQKATLEKENELLKKRESDLHIRLRKLEDDHSSCLDELRKARQQLQGVTDDFRRLEADSKTMQKRFEKEAHDYREQLQQEWKQARTQLLNDFDAERLRSRREYDLLQQQCTDARRALDYAKAKVGELEADRLEYEERTREELQRRLMTNYRDMVQDIAPRRPLPAASSSRAPVLPSSRLASANKENELPTDRIQAALNRLRRPK